MALRQSETMQYHSGRHLISGDRSTPDEVSLAYLEQLPSGSSKGIILLIHGFPQTSYQWRLVIGPLAEAGYHVIAPDSRGAGMSSKPRGLEGYRKAQMADDLVKLLDAIGVQGKVNVVGHDIGGMVAHSLASRHPDKVRSVMWGECPQPGTSIYEDLKKSEPMFHFTFHQQADLPEALVQGKERTYLMHFYNRLGFNLAPFTPEVIDHYVSAYSQAGGLRCGFDAYRAFELDAEDNRAWLKSEGKCKVPACAFSGAEGLLAKGADKQFEELYQDHEVKEVERSGHWVAEENPEGCVEAILDFVGRH